MEAQSGKNKKQYTFVRTLVNIRIFREEQGQIFHHILLTDLFHMLSAMVDFLSLSFDVL